MLIIISYCQLIDINYFNKYKGRKSLHTYPDNNTLKVDYTSLTDLDLEELIRVIAIFTEIQISIYSIHLSLIETCTTK